MRLGFRIIEQHWKNIEDKPPTTNCYYHFSYRFRLKAVFGKFKISAAAILEGAGCYLKSGKGAEIK
jgi:hypothetical protein